jgi:hypothetical protein
MNSECVKGNLLGKYMDTETGSMLENRNKGGDDILVAKGR